MMLHWPPSRQLDVFLALQVLEYPICDSASDLQLPSRCSLYGHQHWSTDGVAFAATDKDVPALSSDVAAAWVLLDHFVMRGAKVAVTSRYGPGVWGCSIILDCGKPQERFCFQTSEGGAAHAICLATIDACRLSELLTTAISG